MSKQRFTKPRQAPLHAPEPEAPAPHRDIDAERRERAIQWQADADARVAICAGLGWQDCIRALVRARHMTATSAELMGVTP